MMPYVGYSRYSANADTVDHLLGLVGLAFFVGQRAQSREQFLLLLSRRMQPLREAPLTRAGLDSSPEPLVPAIPGTCTRYTGGRQRFDDPS